MKVNDLQWQTWTQLFLWPIFLNVIPYNEEKFFWPPSLVSTLVIITQLQILNYNYVLWQWLWLKHCLCKQKHHPWLWTHASANKFSDIFSESDSLFSSVPNLLKLTEHLLPRLNKSSQILKYKLTLTIIWILGGALMVLE